MMGKERNLIDDLKLCVEATPGPWETVDGAEIAPKTGQKAHVELCRVVGPWDGSNWYTDKEAKANARFIAEAREGWPHAIRRALEAEAERDELRKIVSSECPIGALDLVNSLRVEKWHMQERIAELEAEVERLKQRIEELENNGS